MKTLYLSLLLVVVSACGSKLPAKDPAYGHPSSGAVVDISTAKESTLEQFVIEKNSKYTMLVFGSEYCLGCVEKNKALKKYLYKKHPVFSNADFNLYGVNIDYELEYIKEYIDRTGFSFIQVWDKEANFLVSNFYKGDEDWGVPTTVFLKGNEVVFKYGYMEHQDMKEILDRAATYIGLDQ